MSRVRVPSPALVTAFCPASLWPAQGPPEFERRGSLANLNALPLPRFLAALARRIIHQPLVAIALEKLHQPLDPGIAMNGFRKHEVIVLGPHRPERQPGLHARQLDAGPCIGPSTADRFHHAAVITRDVTI